MLIRVTLVYSPDARQVFERAFELEAGATVRQAVDASGVLQAYPGLDLSLGGVGVWGRKAPPGQLLHDRDRVEIYRPLVGSQGGAPGAFSPAGRPFGRSVRAPTRGWQGGILRPGGCARGPAQALFSCTRTGSHSAGA